MNIHRLQSRPHLLHLIAFLLVCTTVFLTVVAPILADQCDEWRKKRDAAQSDVDTYKREAEEYKKKYDDASWANPQKYYYYWMYHRALDRMFEAMQERDKWQKKIDENCSGSSGGCD